MRSARAASTLRATESSPGNAGGVQVERRETAATWDSRWIQAVRGERGRLLFPEVGRQGGRGKGG
jgi:hypothetical protein